MNYAEFVKHIQKGPLHQVYLFSGSEDYLIEDSVRRLTELVITDPSTREFNHDVFYADEADAGKIIETANAYPMFADWRMVTVRDLNKLAPSGLAALSKYLQKPAPTTKLVLTAEKLTRHKAFQEIKARSCFVECKPLYDSHIPRWIQTYVKGLGYSISHEACLLIQAHVGNNLRAIVNEIEKILLNVSGRQKLEEEDVQKVVGLSRKFSVFDLNDAIGSRRLEQALAILNKMLESGESPTGIIAMLTRHFGNLLKVKACAAERKSDQTITSLTGIPPFFISKTKSMAANFSYEQLQRAFECLLQTDLILKTSQQSPQLALQTMLMQILR